MSRLTGSAYQYLQRSQLRTDKFQRNMMPLALPKLDKTCAKYLQSMEAVFGEDPRMTTARDVTKQFENGEGKNLHNELVQYNKEAKARGTSYIYDFWTDSYLTSRKPLPLNYNPFMAWRDETRPSLNDQLVRSANITASIMRFKRSLEENVLNPELYYVKGSPKSTELARKIMVYLPDLLATFLAYGRMIFPLDMRQHKYLFSTTRIPKMNRDEVVKFDADESRHMLVIKHGQFFVFDVLDANGDLYSPEHIYANLQHIAQLAKPAKDTDLSISELSTAERNLWAQDREHLAGLSDRNKNNIRLLDSAIYALCLDETSYKEEQKVDAAHNFLHGSNKSGPLNRWFDKSFSIIVTKDAHASINFEHSWGDGVAVLRLFNEIYDDTTKQPALDHIPSDAELKSCKLDSVRRLEFDLDSRLKSSISACRKRHIDTTSSLEISAVQYSSLDKNYFKKRSLSADAMFQLSFQLAFRKVFGKTPVTYESCSTAAFKGGRTETVRPTSAQSKAAIDAIIKNSSDLKSAAPDLAKLLDQSSKTHYSMCADASRGHGFDRHLFALRELAVRAGKGLTALFSDAIYTDAQHFTLSTSTLYGESFSGGGFAPVVPDGYGLGYGYVDNDFGVLVSSYKPHRPNGQFADALRESLDDVRQVCDNMPTTK